MTVKHGRNSASSAMPIRTSGRTSKSVDPIRDDRVSSASWRESCTNLPTTSEIRARDSQAQSMCDAANT